MREIAVVTGAAGFIGSNLAEALVRTYYVIGIDCFTPCYPKKTKMQNISGLRSNCNFEFVEADLTHYDGFKSLKADLIFHLAAEPGVRASWGSDFETYMRNNVSATQKILEACINSPPRKFIFASSSSVYGDAATSPMTEKQTPMPASPYGVTKLAAENLCYVYHKNHHLPIVSLRYFTVYGPKMRPDLAISRFTSAILEDKEITLYGDGSQSRDFIYVSDVVEANLRAARSNIEGETFNIGSGKRTTVIRLIRLLEERTGKRAKIRRLSPQKGEVYTTLACIKKAEKILGYSPNVTLEDGLSSYVSWVKAGCNN